MLAPLLLLGQSSLSVVTSTGRLETVYPARDRKATVVFVVLRDCPIARKFSPEMARLKSEFGGKGIRFLMAFADPDATMASMRDHLREFGIAFPAVGPDPRLMRLIGARAVPTAAIVDAAGRLRYVGRIDDRFPALGSQRTPTRRDLRLALGQFLAGRSVVPASTPVVGCALTNPAINPTIGG